MRNLDIHSLFNEALGCLFISSGNTFEMFSVLGFVHLHIAMNTF